jgi:hypothetical protein
MSGTMQPGLTPVQHVRLTREIGAVVKTLEKISSLIAPMRGVRKDRIEQEILRADARLETVRSTLDQLRVASPGDVQRLDLHDLAKRRDRPRRPGGTQ